MTETVIEKQPREKTQTSVPWNVVVHNDPVNLMSYVTMVLQKVFGYARERAERHMLEVHHKGRSVVWSGSREPAEHYVQLLHGYLLLATIRNPNNVEIIRLDVRTVEIREIDSFLAELLSRIPAEAVPGNDANALERLFSNPTNEPQDELNRDWKSYVQPELRHLFESANETVSRDLKGLKSTKNVKKASQSLRIPVSHLHQWLSTLNQARLVLAARNKFTEAELAAELAPVINSKRDMCLLQIHLYGFMQEIFLREIG